MRKINKKNYCSIIILYNINIIDYHYIIHTIYNILITKKIIVVLLYCIILI